MGFGLPMCEMYSSICWTPAYLDIAGSEPPTGEADPGQVRG